MKHRRSTPESAGGPVSLSGDLTLRVGGAGALVPAHPSASAANLRVFQAGEIAFSEILSRVEQARSSIEVRAFLWRDDEVGNRLGRAVLAAADRGVRVRIRKDRIAAVYEYAAGSRQSFFHKRVGAVERFQAWFLGTVARSSPASGRPRANPLAEAILAHPNIEVSHKRKRFDHSKLFIFDDRVITLGSMGIGDNHHSDWVDVMVELEGAAHVARLRDRLAGRAGFDPERDIDFLVHTRDSHRRRSCPMLGQRLALIDAAERSLTVEMAYMGDRRFTAALLRAIKRGVHVKLVTAAKADVLGNLNRATCDTLLRRSGAPKHVTVVLLPRMVHSKIVVADSRVADVGSANFTPLSHGVYDEINLYAVHEPFARAVEAAIEAHCGEGEVVEGRVGYRRLHSQLERVIVAYQSRRGGRLPRSQRVAVRAEERRLARAHRLELKAERRRVRARRRRFALMGRAAENQPLLLPGPDSAEVGPDAADAAADAAAVPELPLAPAESAVARRRLRLIPRRLRRARRRDDDRAASAERDADAARSAGEAASAGARPGVGPDRRRTGEFVDAAAGLAPAESAVARRRRRLIPRRRRRDEVAASASDERAGALRRAADEAAASAELAPAEAAVERRRLRLIPRRLRRVRRRKDPAASEPESRDDRDRAAAGTERAGRRGSKMRTPPS